MFIHFYTHVILQSVLILQGLEELQPSEAVLDLAVALCLGVRPSLAHPRHLGEEQRLEVVQHLVVGWEEVRLAHLQAHLVEHLQGKKVFWYAPEMEFDVRYFLASRDKDVRGANVKALPSEYASVASTKTLTLAITFKTEVIELSNCTCVFLMTTPFTWYSNF